jgi:hypothetical protein
MNTTSSGYDPVTAYSEHGSECLGSCSEQLSASQERLYSVMFSLLCVSYFPFPLV